MQTEARKYDVRKTIDNLTPILYKDDMVRVSDIQKALQQQVAADIKRLGVINAEQGKLREQYNRYRDLDEEKKLKDSRLRRTASLLGRIYEEMVDDSAELGAYAVAVSDLTLWEAMLAILEQVPEMQLHELQYALREMGKPVSRQAIESAVTTHKDKLHADTRRRERFVSLKR